MGLFRPDTRTKNMFLTKMSLSVGQPILLDMYRFGSRFEFQYGTFPAMTNWLDGQPGPEKCVQMASRRRKMVDTNSDEITEHVDTGWETVHCNKGTYFLCQVRDIQES